MFNDDMISFPQKLSIPSFSCPSFIPFSLEGLACDAVITQGRRYTREAWRSRGYSCTRDAPRGRVLGICCGVCPRLFFPFCTPSCPCRVSPLYCRRLLKRSSCAKRRSVVEVLLLDTSSANHTTCEDASVQHVPW